MIKFLVICGLLAIAHNVSGGLIGPAITVQPIPLPTIIKGPLISPAIATPTIGWGPAPALGWKAAPLVPLASLSPISPLGLGLKTLG